jgi:uncharacterized protein (TIGR03086 family)
MVVGLRPEEAAMETRELFHRTVLRWQEIVRGVGDGQWAEPTPCEGWDVRALLNHVCGEGLWAVPLFNGSTIEEVGDRFDGDVLGGVPRDAALGAARAADAVAAERVVPGARVHLSYGEEDAGEYAMQLAADHLVHGWDLAAATGQDRAMDPELVAAVAAWFADREAIYRSAGAVGPRGSATGDPQAELLAAFGRASDWAPTV